MGTVPPARALACAHTCQHSYEVFIGDWNYQEWNDWLKSAAHVKIISSSVEVNSDAGLSFHSLDRLLLNGLGGRGVKVNIPSFLLVTISLCPSKHQSLLCLTWMSRYRGNNNGWKGPGGEEVMWDLKVLMESSLHPEGHNISLESRVCVSVSAHIYLSVQ